MPFHWWLPDAHAIAPAPGYALFSGAMVTAGLCGIARIDTGAFAAALAPQADRIRWLLVGLGAATAVARASCAA